MEVTLSTGHKIRKVIREVTRSELRPDIHWPNDKVTVLLVDHNRGHAYKSSRCITVPNWSLLEKDGYISYYVSHELAHVDCDSRYHDNDFYMSFKQICPIELQHYELEYKPRNASKSGIARGGVIPDE